jgi:hypothetical protein
MNGKYGLPALVAYNYSAKLAKCPEDALNAIQRTGTLKERVKIQLDVALRRASDLQSVGGKDRLGRFYSEIEVYELARWKYDEIKIAIMNWAKQQSWWCELRIIGLYDPPRFYNCKFVPCNP